MMRRVGRALGAVFVWTVVLAACTVGLILCLPVFAIAVVVRGSYDLIRAFAHRGEESGVPDEATPELAEHIDGRRTLGCGCPVGPVLMTCIHCGWRSCYEHRDATHLCERTQLYDWQHEWPVNRLKPYRLDDSAAEPNELLNEIYAFLEAGDE